MILGIPIYRFTKYYNVYIPVYTGILVWYTSIELVQYTGDHIGLMVPGVPGVPSTSTGTVDR